MSSRLRSSLCCSPPQPSARSSWPCTKRKRGRNERPAPAPRRGRWPWRTGPAGRGGQQPPVRAVMELPVVGDQRGHLPDARRDRRRAGRGAGGRGAGGRGAGGRGAGGVTAGSAGHCPGRGRGALALAPEFSVSQPSAGHVTDEVACTTRLPTEPAAASRHSAGVARGRYIAPAQARDAHQHDRAGKLACCACCACCGCCARLPSAACAVAALAALAAAAMPVTARRAGDGGRAGSLSLFTYITLSGWAVASLSPGIRALPCFLRRGGGATVAGMAHPQPNPQAERVDVVAEPGGRRQREHQRRGRR